MFSLLLHTQIFLHLYHTGTTGQTTTVTCDTGYSGSSTVTCGTDGQFNTLTCTAKTCTPTGNIANSNKADAGSITGTTTETVTITCDTGYSGGGKTTCAASGTFTTLPTCAANSCTPTNVANSNKADIGSITGTTSQTVKVTCNAGFSGTGTTVCQTSGVFSSIPICIKCVSGKYNDAPDQPTCKDDCGAGSFIVEDKSSCDICPYGTWQDLEDQSSCKKCAKGKISRKEKQTSGTTCVDCVIGQYNPNEGHKDSCYPCPGAASQGAIDCAGW